MTTEIITLLEQGLTSSPERDNIINLLGSDDDRDETKRKHDKAFHLLMDGAREFHEIKFVAKALLVNVNDLRPNVHERFVKECSYQETLAFFKARILMGQNRDNLETIGKYDRGAHDLIIWAETPEEWTEVAEELLRSVEDLHEGVYRHFLKDSPEDVKENFNVKLAVQLTKMLEQVKCVDKSDITRMWWLIDILGEPGTKVLFEKLRDKWGALPASVAKRLNMSTGDDENSSGPVGFTSSAPAFLSNPLVKPHKTLEQWETEGWVVHQDSGRQIVIRRGEEYKTIHRPKDRSASPKRHVAKKVSKKVADKKGAGDK